MGNLRSHSYIVISINEEYWKSSSLHQVYAIYPLDCITLHAAKLTRMCIFSKLMKYIGWNWLMRRSFSILLLSIYLSSSKGKHSPEGHLRWNVGQDGNPTPDDKQFRCSFDVSDADADPSSVLLLGSISCVLSSVFLHNWFFLLQKPCPDSHTSEAQFALCIVFLESSSYPWEVPAAVATSTLHTRHQDRKFVPELSKVLAQMNAERSYYSQARWF